MTGRSFEPGTLRRRLEETSERARAQGALEPIATTTRHIDDRGVRFHVRLVERIERKLASRTDQERTGRNPFLPYEEELFVADVSESHVAVLNKFNVLDRHLLVVTREFEEQESLLTPRDFEAIWKILPELDALFFYNAGPEAGASQRHKHLQLVPLPLGPGPGGLPMESYLSPERWRELPFPCHFVDLSAVREAGAARDRYLSSLAALGRPNDPRAYNLLLTRDFLLVVPRTRQSWEAISVNALGFAGTMLVTNDEELSLLRRKGPMSVLEEVTS